MKKLLNDLKWGCLGVLGLIGFFYVLSGFGLMIALVAIDECWQLSATIVLFDLFLIVFYIRDAYFVKK